jgi:hypothetical protein
VVTLGPTLAYTYGQYECIIHFQNHISGFLCV